MNNHLAKTLSINLSHVIPLGNVLIFVIERIILLTLQAVSLNKKKYMTYTSQSKDSDAMISILLTLLDKNPSL